MPILERKGEERSCVKKRRGQHLLPQKRGKNHPERNKRGKKAPPLQKKKKKKKNPPRTKGNDATPVENTPSSSRKRRIRGPLYIWTSRSTKKKKKRPTGGRLGTLDYSLQGKEKERNAAKVPPRREEAATRRTTHLAWGERCSPFSGEKEKRESASYSPCNKGKKKEGRKGESLHEERGGEIQTHTASYLKKK